MKSRQEIALDEIAGIGVGVEQDIADIEKFWPKSRRGSKAERAFASLVSRIRMAVLTAYGASLRLAAEAAMTCAICGGYCHWIERDEAHPRPWGFYCERCNRFTEADEAAGPPEEVS